MKGPRRSRSKKLLDQKFPPCKAARCCPSSQLAYETYGTLAPNGRNAILVTHGYTSSQHAAGLDANGEAGWWDGLIGPGKAIDTNKYFVVSSNMLGSSYGSTAPASINPKTGKPYGPDFPDYTLVDIVTAQRALLDALGVKHLVAVAGLSFGGYQAFQWGVTFPDAMRGIVPVVTAPNATDGDRMVADLRARFAEGARMERRPSLRQRGDARLHDRAAGRDAQAVRHRG